MKLTTILLITVFGIVFILAGCNIVKDERGGQIESTENTIVLTTTPRVTVEHMPIKGIDDENDTLKEKVEKLGIEISKYNLCFSPNQKSERIKEYKDILKGILIEKKSISVNSNHILDSNSHFYIKFGKEMSISQNKYRIVEFGPKKPDMGTITTVFVQQWTSNKTPTIQEIYETVQSQNVFKLIDSSFYQVNGTSFINIYDKMYGPESVYIRLFSFKYTSSSWIPYNKILEDNYRDWSFQNKNDYIIINNNKVTFDNEMDLNANINSNLVHILLLDKNQKELDKLVMKQTSEKWEILK